MILLVAVTLRSRVSCGVIDGGINGMRRMPMFDRMFKPKPKPEFKPDLNAKCELCPDPAEYYIHVNPSESSDFSTTVYVCAVHIALLMHYRFVCISGTWVETLDEARCFICSDSFDTCRCYPAEVRSLMITWLIASPMLPLR